MTISNNKGIAIISTIGLIALLSVIAISFAINMQLEVKAAFNTYNAFRARAMAEAGISRAIAELKYGTNGATSDSVDSRSEPNWDATQNGWVFTVENDSLDNNSSGAADEVGEIDNALSYETVAQDCASKININDTNPNLTAILNNIAAVIGGGVIDVNTGDIIVGNRPAGGYRTIEQIKFFKTLGTLDNQSINQAEFDLLRDFITVHSFIDLTTSSPGLASMPRSPINVNTAPTEVLQSALRGLSDGTNAITDTEALNIATSIITATGTTPFTTWDTFWTFLQLREADNTINDGDAALIMANANPNTDIMKFNPNKSWLDKHRYYDAQSQTIGAKTRLVVTETVIDKSDLTTYTTEFCFNSGGFYEIVSTGEVFNDNDLSTGARRLAQQRIRSIIKIYDVWKETTQADFRQGNISANLDDYPEPFFQAAASWDGQIMLNATSVSNPIVTTDGLRASFTNDANADFSQGGATSAVDVSGHLPNSGVGETVSHLAANPSDIMNDGLLIDRSLANKRDVQLSYAQSGNIYNREGTIEMWIKTLWDGSTYGGGSSETKAFFSVSNPGGGLTEADGGGYIAMTKRNDEGPYGGPRLYLISSNYLKQVKTGAVSNAVSYNRMFANFNNFIYPHWEGHIWKHITVTWFMDEGTTPVINTPIPYAKTRTVDSTVMPRKGFIVLLYYNGQLFWNGWVPVIDPPINHKNYTDNPWAHSDSGTIGSGAESRDWYYDKRTTGSEASTSPYDHDGDPMTLDVAPIGNRYTYLIDDPLSANMPPDIRIWGECPGMFNLGNMYIGWDNYIGPKNIDSTIDEIRIYDTALDKANPITAPTILSHYNQGRYYNGNDAEFISQSSPAITNSPLGTISWTEHIPSGISGDIEFDISLDDGTTWLGNSFTNPAGVAIIQTANGNIKYKATFRSNATPLLDTPILNDVAITYLTPTEILYWRNIE